ncbi:14671_t:CDS:2 [Entrophospora sp. SA101]|nr:14671_t:CDS:2 [Entrophospora sp. SA101]
MSDRPVRRRRQRNPYLSTASNAFFVGYVEDDEPVEAIMKKFEELEKIQQEIAATKPENLINDDNVEEEPLTEEQLEEVFKRTSTFTVKSATLAPNVDDFEDIELWRIEMENSIEEYYEEDDYMAVDDDFWDEEFGDKKKRKRDKKDQLKEVSSSRYFEKDILSMDLKKLGTNFQAVYIDPPLLLPGENPSPGKITVEQLGKLNVTAVVPKGFLFIWVEKEFIPDIVQIAENWKFRYVENFCWIKKNLNNQISHQPYRYFNKSKNPDCLFDFIKPETEDMLTEAKPRVVYEIIETLLPQAAYSETNNKGDRLLELYDINELYVKDGQQLLKVVKDLK